MRRLTLFRDHTDIRSIPGTNTPVALLKARCMTQTLHTYVLGNSTATEITTQRGLFQDNAEPTTTRQNKTHRTKYFLSLHGNYAQVCRNTSIIHPHQNSVSLVCIRYRVLVPILSVVVDVMVKDIHTYRKHREWRMGKRNGEWNIEHGEWSRPGCFLLSLLFFCTGAGFYTGSTSTMQRARNSSTIGLAPLQWKTLEQQDLEQQSFPQPRK
ncbi:hypothetical protein NECID01_1940 [Nematocida sp. AWRm77]|nr:hypothetical protein NECID01_1940 [Nematocida sp. AWRm77]